MSDGLAVVPVTAGIQSWQQAVEKAEAYVNAAKSPATLRAYRADWRHFDGWCSGRGVASLPADPRVVGLYLAECAGLQHARVATIARRIAAISKTHQEKGHESPASMKHAAVSAVWKGIRREHGVAQSAKAPVLIDDVRRMLETIPGRNELLGHRDRALLLIGFAGAFRRSELVALDVADVQETGDGLVITIRRSKTDQEGAGRKVALPYGSNPQTCPVRAFRYWLEVSGIIAGALFRPVNRHGQLQDGRLSDKAVALVVKRQAKAAGLDPDLYAGHSLRAGLATAAAIAGVSERSIMQQTGHKSATMVRRYIRDANLFRENAAARVGL